MMNRLDRRSALPHDPSSHVGSSWNGNVNRRAFAELVLRNVRQLWQSDWVTDSGYFIGGQLQHIAQDVLSGPPSPMRNS